MTKGPEVFHFKTGVQHKGLLSRVIYKEKFKEIIIHMN